MNTAWRIAVKDLRQRLRDRSAVLMAVVLPLALAAIFSLVFGSASTPKPFDYGVVDADGGVLSRAFSDELLAGLADEGVLTLRRAASAAEAERLAADGALDAVFVLPPGFSASVRSQQAARIEVIGSADAPTASAVARSLAESFVAELRAVRLAVGAVAASGTIPHEQIPALAERAAASARPLALADTAATTKVLDATTYTAAGMAVFFLFFTVQFGVASVLDERAGGTLARLLAAPVPRWAVLAGKLGSSVLLGLISMAVLVIATALLLGASWGDPWAVAVLVVAGVLAATGVAAVVASLARTPEQAGNAQAVIAIVLGMLGGAFFPIAQIGGITSALSLATPHAWFLRGLGELAGGGGVVDVLPAAGAMLAFAVVCGVVAAARLGAIVRV